MKRVFLIVALGVALSPESWGVATPIYPVFTDVGISGDNVFTWSTNGPSGVVMIPTSTDVQAPEGQYTIKTQVPAANYGGWGVFNLNGASPRGVDLSAYAASGELRFFANCTTDNFTIAIELADGFAGGSGTKASYNFSGQFGGAFNQWIAVPIALKDLPAGFLTNVYSPFEFTLNNGGSCYIDNVRYVNPPSAQAAVFNVNVRDINTQTSVGALSWSGVTPANGWTRANQYIELQMDDFSDLAWGVQVYTNNTSINSTYKFSGPASSNPAGLINTVFKSQTVPLAWSIKASTQTPAAAAPPSADPTLSSNPNSFQWIFMKDSMTPTIAAQNTSVFIPGELPVTVKSNVGIHYGQRNTDFGAANSPNYLYIEANFGVSMTQSSYQTNTLTIEYFTL